MIDAILLQVMLAKRTAYNDSDLDAKVLLDQGFVVVEEVRNASGFTSENLVIAAPLLATVLLRREKLELPMDVYVPDLEQEQDPW